MLIGWIVNQPFAGNAHSLIARVGSSPRTALRHQAKDKIVTFAPWNGSFPFLHRGRLLAFHCTLRDCEQEIHVSCIGRSPRFLKEFFDECRQKYLEGIQRMVLVFEPQKGEWNRARLRPVRPLSTIVMDAQQKDRVVNDLEDFLNEATRKWYTEHGFPYQRGYLLFGPPGTGKSSFSFSIAGHFGLSIYTLNLLGEPSDLPLHYIVLLEDIDIASIRYRDNFNARKLTRPNLGLTLSGLLNILDGVSSQEGQVLIMIINYINGLDPALIRPGCINKRICFRLAEQDITA